MLLDDRTVIATATTTAIAVRYGHYRPFLYIHLCDCFFQSEARTEYDMRTFEHRCIIIFRFNNSLLALKANQKSLFEDVECAFKMNGEHDMCQTIDADHGRIETRKCSILPAAEYLMEESRRAGFSTTNGLPA